MTINRTEYTEILNVPSAFAVNNGLNEAINSVVELSLIRELDDNAQK